MHDVRALTSDDRGWLIDRLNDEWGGPQQARAGTISDVSRLSGFVALDDAGEPAGVLLYEEHGDELEIALLHAFSQWQGAGSALMERFREVASARPWNRVWLVTTNDNVDALRFYQRRGWRLVALHVGAVDDARATLKPQIPDVGSYDIPMRDEIELEWRYS